MGILDISENHQSMTLWVTGLSCHHSLLTPHQCTYGASIRQLWSWKNTEPELKLNFIKCFTLIAGHREEGTCIKSYCSYLEVIHGLYANDRNLSRVVLNWYLTTWHCLFLPSCWTWNLLINASLPWCWNYLQCTAKILRMLWHSVKVCLHYLCITVT